MKQRNRCPECGTGLSGDTLHGLCPRCLLQMGIEGLSVESAGPARVMSTVLSDETPGVTPSGLGLGLIGEQIDNYRIDELIGTGGFGLVYKAQDIRLDRTAALKFLRNPLDEVARKLFEREAKAIARLNRAQT